MPTLDELLYGRRAYRVGAGAQPYLDRISDAAAEVEAARARLTEAMGAARQADVPLRAIASAAHVSHEQVRRILKRAALGAPTA
jgi:DNA invertase Pin-like site-specific DNA recombinase